MSHPRLAGEEGWGQSTLRVDLRVAYFRGDPYKYLFSRGLTDFIVRLIGLVFGIFEQMLRLKRSWKSSHHSRPHPHISCTITGINIKRDPGVLLQVYSLAAMACRCNGYGCTSVVSSAQQSSSPSGTRLKLGHTKYPARNCRSFRTSSNTATNATDFLGIRNSERHPASPRKSKAVPQTLAVPHMSCGCHRMS